MICEVLSELNRTHGTVVLERFSIRAVPTIN